MARPAEPLSDDVEAVIRKAGDDWAQHWNAKDLDNLVGAYAPDAVYLPPTMLLCTGAMRFAST